MTDICLFIPDAALREAVLEQIAAAAIGAPRIADQAQKAAGADLLIVDVSVFNPEMANLLRSGNEKSVILVLGDGGETDSATESFAKPFRLGHLLTRIRYYIETAPLLRDRVVTFGGFRLEPQNRRLLHDKIAEPIRLTEKETALLVFLADSQAPATRRDILAGVWGYDENIDTHTFETHLYQLRRKLDETGENWLVNEAGAYRLARGGA